MFVFALSRFSGPDYLGAWNRLLEEEQRWSPRDIYGFEVKMSISLEYSFTENVSLKLRVSPALRIKVQTNNRDSVDHN